MGEVQLTDLELQCILVAMLLLCRATMLSILAREGKPADYHAVYIHFKENLSLRNMWPKKLPLPFSYTRTGISRQIQRILHNAKKAKIPEGVISLEGIALFQEIQHILAPQIAHALSVAAAPVMVAAAAAVVPLFVAAPASPGDADLCTAISPGAQSSSSTESDVVTPEKSFEGNRDALQLMGANILAVDRNPALIAPWSPSKPSSPVAGELD